MGTGAKVAIAIVALLVIIGMLPQVLDAKFARALMARSDLTLGQVLLLDRVQKGRPLTPAEAQTLKGLGLIEGRTPRFFISAKVADVAGQKARYIHNRGLDEGIVALLPAAFVIALISFMEVMSSCKVIAIRTRTRCPAPPTALAKNCSTSAAPRCSRS